MGEHLITLIDRSELEFLGPFIPSFRKVICSFKEDDWPMY